MEINRRKGSISNIPRSHSSFGKLNNECLEGNCSSRRQPPKDGLRFLHTVLKKHLYSLLVFFFGFHILRTGLSNQRRFCLEQRV